MEQPIACLVINLQKIFWATSSKEWKLNLKFIKNNKPTSSKLSEKQQQNKEQYRAAD